MLPLLLLIRKAPVPSGRIRCTATQRQLAAARLSLQPFPHCLDPCLILVIALSSLLLQPPAGRAGAAADRLPARHRPEHP